MIKIIVDILLFVLLIIEYSRVYMTPLLHEIIGSLLLIVIITHLILNRNYLKNIFKGKYNASRIVLLLVNVLLFLCIFSTIIFGILISQYLFTFIGKYNMTISKLHIMTSYFGLLVMGAHLGLNLNQMLIKMKFLKNKIVAIVLHLLIYIYGIISINKTDFFSYLLGEKTFFLKDTSLLINFLRFSSISLLITLIVFDINLIIRKIKANKKER